MRASVAFPALALFDLLREPIRMLPSSFSAYINASVALKRLQEFLGVRAAGCPNSNNPDPDPSLKHNLNLNLKPAKQLRSIPQPRLHSPGTLSVLRDLISTQGRCIGPMARRPAVGMCGVTIHAFSVFRKRTQHLQGP